MVANWGPGGFLNLSDGWQFSWYSRALWLQSQTTARVVDGSHSETLRKTNSWPLPRNVLVPRAFCFHGCLAGSDDLEGEKSTWNLPLSQQFSDTVLMPLSLKFFKLSVRIICVHVCTQDGRGAWAVRGQVCGSLFLDLSSG